MQTNNIKVIFVIPIDQADHPKADPRLTSLTSILAKHNEIIGRERAPYFNTSNKFLRRIRFVGYVLRVIILGLRQARRIDLIIGMQEYFGLIGAVISFIIRKPYMWDTHGNLLAHRQLLDNSFLYIRLILLLDKIIGRIAKVIVVPSEIDRQLYIEQKYKYVNKIVVIPSGVDLSLVTEVKGDKEALRKDLGLDSSKKILMFMGKRDYPLNKEAADWINEELAPVIARKFNDVQILIVGPGEIPSQVNPIVTYTGFVPNIYQYISACDICLVPYRLRTGISVKVLDSMACAKAIITTSSVASLIPQLVNGNNIITSNDYEEFIDRTVNILHTPELAIKIGANARKVIEEHYSLEVVARKWQHLVETCRETGDN